jgi:predicted transcriptional regulator
MNVIEPMKPKEIFLDDIREKMRELGISQADLAEFLSLHQPEISKTLSGRRRLLYNEAEHIVSYIFGKMSLIPPESIANEKATSEGELEWAYSDETLGDVAKRMFCKGFSQLPVMDRASNEFTGVISELSIIRKMMRPDRSLEEWREAKIKEAGVVESYIRFSPNTPTHEVAQLLLSYPAILLEEKLQITGIITRADLLKYLFTD